jgi:hypothetical protein
MVCPSVEGACDGHAQTAGITAFVGVRQRSAPAVRDITGVRHVLRLRRGRIKIEQTLKNAKPFVSSLLEALPW